MESLDGAERKHLGIADLPSMGPVEQPNSSSPMVVRKKRIEQLELHLKDMLKRQLIGKGSVEVSTELISNLYSVSSKLLAQEQRSLFGVPASDPRVKRLEKYSSALQEIIKNIAASQPPPPFSVVMPPLPPSANIKTDRVFVRELIDLGDTLSDSFSKDRAGAALSEIDQIHAHSERLKRLME